MALIQSLDNPRSLFDAAVFAHSLWYFPSLEAVTAVFRTLGDAAIPAIYVAEYSTEGVSSPDQKAHHLAAKAQRLFYAYSQRPEDELTPVANIRAAPDQEFIIGAAQAAGYVIARQGTITPEADYYEGQVEVRHVLTKFSARVNAQGLDPEKEAEILSFVPLVQKEVDATLERGFKHARCVDVWWTEFRYAALPNRPGPPNTVSGRGAYNIEC